MKYQHQEHKHCRGLEETVDAAGEDSFPASDPPAWSATHLGTPDALHGPEMFYDVVQRMHDDVRLFSETIGERNDRSPRGIENLERARAAIEDRFHDLGLPVRHRAVNSFASNVEAVLRGARLASESIVIGAHYDSARGSPGADDNASGLAMLFALGRSLRGLRLDRTVRLVAFAAEEAPHAGTEEAGSARYLSDLTREGPRVKVMMSLDALGVYAQQKRPWPFRLVRLLRADLALVGDRETRPLLARVMRAFAAVGDGVAVAPVTFPLLFAPIRSQAHYVFARAGVPAFMVTDTRPLWSLEFRRDTDTADQLDYERLACTSLALGRIARELACPTQAAV